MYSTVVLGWLGAALSMALPWPQVWRSVAKGRTSGLCAVACWQGTAMPIGWITYGLLTGETVQVVTNTVTGLAGLSILVAVLIKQGELRTRRRLLTGAAGAAGVLCAAAICAVATATTDFEPTRLSAFLGSVLAVAATLAAVPQPLSLLRNRTQDLAGLSPLRWRLTAAACSCWCAYGLVSGQVAVWLSASVGLTAALIVCWVLMGAGRNRAPHAVATA
ncbi:SemiSWEET transporter [Actinoplanes sp. NPDC026623]|uniref:SemiSWEET transporter n=1 Tax=Actinoplanes sp. NPDC026623 TaxID=3155610 RepID=UPI0033DDB683